MSKIIYNFIVEQVKHKLNERRGDWPFGPQDWDIEKPSDPSSSPTSPTGPKPIWIPPFNNGYNPYVNEPVPPGPGGVHTNQEIDIPPRPPSGLPAANPNSSTTNSPMEIGPREILPGIFDTGSIGKPNGNSPPIIWYQEQDGLWHRGVLQCTFTGCVYARSDDIFDVGRDSPPNGYVIWNPNPAPGHFEVYHEPEFDWWPFW